ncbi:myo-inositol transporter [Penicillium alfredii]|uniref:Myo-inositol transporter n=1 Tax=Penicillium alfredii TaxID=1506179 RepID=A0A9W9JWS2_9EURO|nr:myo-inositol transporter [Penicillium alfredii]KAJ5084241.1 myo-inositol transporter [Penicillium alfredii]
MDANANRSSLDKDEDKADVVHEELSALELDDSIEKTDPGVAVWLIACTVSMGGFLFGIHPYSPTFLAQTSAPPSAPMNKNSSQPSHPAAPLIGAVLAGLSSDKYGRKLGIYLGCVLFVVGAVVQAAAFSLAQMTVGRFVVGLGVGSAAMIVPLYIGEMAPARFRGRMIVFDNLCVAFGQLVSYALGAGFTHVAAGWRWMVAIGAVPALALAAFLPKCPESPRQLIAHGRVSEADAALRRIFPRATDAQVAGKIRLIEQAASSISERSLGWQIKQLLCVPANLRALVTACMVMAISQLGGFNTLMYYSSTLFSMVGFNQPTSVSIVVGGTNFIFGFFNFAVIDRVGRRVSLSLVVTAIAFHWIPVNNLSTITSSSSSSGETTWATILLLVMIITYVAFFAAGVAPVAWVGTELLPLEVRALGTMINSVVCWGCNLIISSTFLSMMKTMTPSGTFGFYAGICFIGWVFVLGCYAEVHNMPLEAVREVYESGFGVRKAKVLQREIRGRRDAEARAEAEAGKV